MLNFRNPKVAIPIVLIAGIFWSFGPYVVRHIDQPENGYGKEQQMLNVIFTIRARLFEVSEGVRRISFVLSHPGCCLPAHALTQGRLKRHILGLQLLELRRYSRHLSPPVDY